MLVWPILYRSEVLLIYEFFVKTVYINTYLLWQFVIMELKLLVMRQQNKSNGFLLEIYKHL